MTQTVVVPLLPPDVDEDRLSERALPVATALAERVGANMLLLSLVEVSPDLKARPETPAVAREVEQVFEERQVYLEQVAATITRVPVDTAVGVGDPSDELLSLLDRLPDPLLVMATERRPALLRILHGGPTRAVLQSAPCPVLLVREPVPDDWTPSSVVVPLDGSAFGEMALDAVRAVLGDEDLTIHLVHVLDYITGADHATSTRVLNQYLQQVASRLPSETATVDWEVRFGSVASEIIEAAQERGARLIAMATHSRSGAERLLLGSDAERVVNRAPMPVLLVRPELHDLARLEEERVAEQARRRAIARAIRQVPIRDILTSPVVTVREDDTLDAVAKTMLEHQIGCAPVVDQNGHLVGIITESDFLRGSIPFWIYEASEILSRAIPAPEVEHLFETGRKLTASAVMTQPVVTAAPEDSVGSIADQMRRHGIHRIPVVQDGVPVGIVTRRDLLKLLLLEESRVDPD